MNLDGQTDRQVVSGHDPRETDGYRQVFKEQVGVRQYGDRSLRSS